MGELADLVDFGYDQTSREAGIADTIRSEHGRGVLGKMLADVEVEHTLQVRRDQRRFAEEAPAEVSERARDILDNLHNRHHVLGALRNMTPEMQQEVMMAAPGVAQQMGDMREGIGIRAGQAFSRGVTHGLAQPVGELLGTGGTDEEIEQIRQFDAMARQEFHPYRADDPWYVRGPLAAIEMAPWMATAITGAGAGRSLATKAAGKASLGAKATAWTAKGGELAGITTATFPSQYAQEVDTLKAAGVEDGPMLRTHAAATAVFQGLVEGAIPNPFVGRVPLTQGAKKAAQRYLSEAAKRAPVELTEEYIQGAVSGAAEALATYLDENAPDTEFGEMFRRGWEQTKEAALPMAFLLGAPAAVGSGVTAARARRTQPSDTQAEAADGVSAEPGTPTPSEGPAIDEVTDGQTQPGETDAGTIRSAEEEAGEQEGSGPDVRRSGQVEEGTEQAGEGAQAQREEEADRPEEGVGPAEGELNDALAELESRFGYLAKPVAAASDQETDAVEFGKARGLNVQFVETEQDAPVRGASKGRTVLVRSGMAEDTMWGVVGHEVAHGADLQLTGVEQPEIDAAAERYLQRVSEKNAEAVRADKAKYRREGVAQLVQDFMQDKNFRDRLNTENPTLWQKLRDAVLRIIGNFTPGRRNAQQVLAELRDAGERQPAQETVDRRSELEAMTAKDLRAIAPVARKNRNKQGLIKAILEAEATDTTSEESRIQPGEVISYRRQGISERAEGSGTVTNVRPDGKLVLSDDGLETIISPGEIIGREAPETPVVTAPTETATEPETPSIEATAEETEKLKKARAEARTHGQEDRIWGEFRKQANREIKGEKKRFKVEDLAADYPDGVRGELLSENWAATQIGLMHIPTGKTAVSGNIQDAKMAYSMMQSLGIDPESVVNEEGLRGDADIRALGRIRDAVQDKDLGKLGEQRREFIKDDQVAPTNVEADIVLDSYDLGMRGRPKNLKDDGAKIVKQLAKEIPAFAVNPVFTVTKETGGDGLVDTYLVYHDGAKYRFNPEVFNLGQNEVEDGQTVGINLEDMGIRRPEPQAAVVKVLRDFGMAAVKKNKDGSIVGSFRNKKFKVAPVANDITGAEWEVDRAAGNSAASQQAADALEFAGFHRTETTDEQNEGGETAAEAAQRRAEESRPVVKVAGFGPGGGEITTERIRDDQIPDAIKAPEEQERRLQNARGMRKPSLMQKIKEAVSHLKNVTRAQEHIPNTEEFAPANEFFRLLRNAPSMAQDEAIRTTAAIADPLGPNQLYFFERYTIIENLAASLKLGQPLRFGFKSAEDVEAYRSKLEKELPRVPEVQEAIETRRNIVRETVDKLVDYKLLPEEAKENADTYYHQQVHMHMVAEGMKGGTRAGKVERSFQKKRVLGEELSDEQMDYNTSYLESEISWLTDANMEIEKERLLRQLMDKYDIRKQLVEQAEEGQPWQDLVPDGYEVFQPEPGNHFYRAFTVPDKLVEHLHENVLEAAELTKDDLKAVLAIGMPSRQFVVPTEIATQLSETRKSEAPHGLAWIADTLMRTWKVYTLLNPKRAIAYNLRNMTGDIDPVVAADPKLLKHSDRAMRELSNYHKGRLQLSPEMRSARDHGVIGSGFVAEEVPEIKDLPPFRRFLSESSNTSLPMRPVKGYMGTVKPLSEWRENMLRYAAFLGYREQLQQGQVKHYGGAKKAVVDQIKEDMGVDAAAAHLARNLLGDYGNISVAGNWIRRRLMPFWSFQEINIKRVPRLVVNAYQSGGTWRTAGALSAAAGRAILMSRVAWMFGALWAWNNLVQGGDEEEELSGYDRAVPHVILGRNPDGSIRVFRRVGALGDFLEWFGVNEAIAMFGKYRAGQVEASDILKEMAFATPEKALNSMRPDMKALYEIPTGQSLFPEPFQPRSVRRFEAAAHIFGLSDEYKWMRGKILGDGRTARPHYWQRLMMGVVDPRHSSLSQAYELRSDFLKQKGKESKGVFPISRYKEARDAAKFEDYDAFVDWKRKFQEERGDKAKKDFKNWLGTLDPVANRLSDSDELEFETEFLTNEQRQRLTVARNYAHELRDLLVAWWDADERSVEMKESVLFSAFRKIDTTRPRRRDYPSDEAHQKAENKFTLGNRRAEEDIKSMAPTREEAQTLLREFYLRPDSRGRRRSTSGFFEKSRAIAEMYPGEEA